EGAVDSSQLPLEPQSHAKRARAGLVTDRTAVHAADARDHAQVRRVADVGARIAPVGMIEDVGGGHLPPQPGGVFAEEEILVQSHVPDVQAGAFDDSLRGGAETAGLRRLESSPYAPVSAGTLASRQ